MLKLFEAWCCSSLAWNLEIMPCLTNLPHQHRFRKKERAASHLWCGLFDQVVQSLRVFSDPLGTNETKWQTHRGNHAAIMQSMRWIRSYCGQASHSLSPAVGFVGSTISFEALKKQVEEYSTVDYVKLGMRCHEMVCMCKYHDMRRTASWFSHVQSASLLEPLLDGTFDLLSQHLDIIEIARTS